MKDCNGEASCLQLPEKYGRYENFYNSGSSALARRVAKKTGCPLLEPEIPSAKLWPILYVGRYAKEGEIGTYIWKLRDELSQVLEKLVVSLYYKGKPVLF